MTEHATSGPPVPNRLRYTWPVGGRRELSVGLVGAALSLCACNNDPSLVGEWTLASNTRFTALCDVEGKMTVEDDDGDMATGPLWWQANCEGTLYEARANLVSIHKFTGAIYRFEVEFLTGEMLLRPWDCFISSNLAMLDCIDNVDGAQYSFTR